jgi:hypothetical protein
MKMTKDEIRALKLKHRLELVIMQETGEDFEIDSKHPDQWHSKGTPGLTVDISRQIFDDRSQGKANSGDVIAWLRDYYSWTFEQAIRYLRNRPADPKREDLPKATKGRKNKNTSLAAGEVKPLDHWQEKALQLGGERIRKYFAWSSWDFILSNEEIRIDPVIAPDITHCQHCNKRFDWIDLLDQNVDLVPELSGYRLEHVGPIPIIAYSIKRRLKVDISRLKQTEVQDALDELLDAQNGVFVEDEDGIICTDCASKELKFHLALSLCKRSAQGRERAEAGGAV